MNESVQYWIPEGVPESLQVALSVPGNPPKTVGDHRARLEFHLQTLAKQEEEEQGKGWAFRQAYEVVKDQLLYLEGETASPELVVQILMDSDLMTNVYLPKESLGPGIKDSELQERCQESQFQDRVYAISQIY
ncbi:hypothetical protein ACFL1V_07960 [Pseudomonadota bacterium]